MIIKWLLPDSGDLCRPHRGLVQLLRIKYDTDSQRILLTARIDCADDQSRAVAIMRDAYPSGDLCENLE